MSETLKSKYTNDYSDKTQMPDGFNIHFKPKCLRSGNSHLGDLCVYA